jgi:hypothetical protein
VKNKVPRVKSVLIDPDVGSNLNFLENNKNMSPKNLANKSSKISTIAK